MAHVLNMTEDGRNLLLQSVAEESPVSFHSIMLHKSESPQGPWSEEECLSSDRRISLSFIDDDLRIQFNEAIGTQPYYCQKIGIYMSKPGPDETTQTVLFAECMDDEKDYIYSKSAGSAAAICMDMQIQDAGSVTWTIPETGTFLLNNASETSKGIAKIVSSDDFGSANDTDIVTPAKLIRKISDSSLLMISARRLEATAAISTADISISGTCSVSGNFECSGMFILDNVDASSVVSDDVVVTNLKATPSVGYISSDEIRVSGGLKTNTIEPVSGQAVSISNISSTGTVDCEKIACSTLQVKNGTIGRLYASKGARVFKLGDIGDGTSFLGIGIINDNIPEVTDRINLKNPSTVYPTYKYINIDDEHIPSSQLLSWSFVTSGQYSISEKKISSGGNAFVGIGMATFTKGDNMISSTSPVFLQRTPVFIVKYKTGNYICIRCSTDNATSVSSMLLDTSVDVEIFA